MGIFNRLFGKKKASTGTGGRAPATDPANDPNMMRVFDGYGRELFIPREKWKNSVLLGMLEKMRNDPDQTYDLLVGALQDGFAADIIPHAEQFARTDPVASRGATILGIVYMQVGRLDDAERVLQGYLDAHGEDGVVLTNLAKVYSGRGDEARAEKLLWHALEVNPNQDNGLEWYAAIHHERGGEPAMLDAFRRVAALPGSWRARIWLARDALVRGDAATAEAFYAEALALAGQPAPTDLLMQMSGDLGNNGRLAEIIRLVEPHFDVAVHGLQVGNNLIKAHFDLGHADEARRILDQLYAQKRPDWRHTLDYWDRELAKAAVAKPASPLPEPLPVTILSVEAPLWMRHQSPFASLLPAKPTGAAQVAVIGGVARMPEASEKPGLQLTDAPGRLSRAVPLVLSERIHLLTEAVGIAAVPWMEGQGFAVFGRPLKDEELLRLMREHETHPPEFTVGIALDTTHAEWQVSCRLVRGADGQCLAETHEGVDAEDPGPGVERLTKKLLKLLAEHAGIRAVPGPDWYEIPAAEDLSDYLLRLEQQLAVSCAAQPSLEGGGLFGEREMLDGAILLCVRRPADPTVRMVFAQTLRLMRKVRPEVLPEYREKVELLQRDHPLSGEVARRVDEAVAEASSA